MRIGADGCTAGESPVLTLSDSQFFPCHTHTGTCIWTLALAQACLRRNSCKGQTHLSTLSSTDQQGCGMKCSRLRLACLLPLCVFCHLQRAAWRNHLCTAFTGDEVIVNTVANVTLNYMCGRKVFISKRLCLQTEFCINVLSFFSPIHAVITEHQGNHSHPQSFSFPHYPWTQLWHLLLFFIFIFLVKQLLMKSFQKAKNEQNWEQHWAGKICCSWNNKWKNVATSFGWNYFEMSSTIHSFFPPFYIKCC